MEISDRSSESKCMSELELVSMRSENPQSMCLIVAYQKVHVCALLKRASPRRFQSGLAESREQIWCAGPISPRVRMCCNSREY